MTAGMLAACGGLRAAAGEGPAGTFSPVRRGVGAFTLRGGTIGWYGAPDGGIVVDSQFALQARVFREGLRQRAGLPIDALINTHHHPDHTGGNAVLRPQARRHVAHATVPEAQREVAERRGLGPQVYADELFAESWRLELADETVSARWYGRAHTSGDIVVHFERANVKHVGDLVFHRLPPVVDRFAGATIPGWMRVLEEIHADTDDDALLIHGHGHPDHGVIGRRADLLRMRDYLGDLWAYVDTGRRAGKSVDELFVPTLPGHPEVYRADWPEALPNAIRAVVAEWDAEYGT